jgi:hypothetical protein
LLSIYYRTTILLKLCSVTNSKVGGNYFVIVVISFGTWEKSEGRSHQSYFLCLRTVSKMTSGSLRYPTHTIIIILRYLKYIRRFIITDSWKQKLADNTTSCKNICPLNVAEYASFLHRNSKILILGSSNMSFADTKHQDYFSYQQNDHTDLSIYSLWFYK